ncbi:hypothetical protein [Burkholderia sp. ABCPW 111]|uniref:hypothetical protein n=1 Tax=Burkholderia sp. ABCPW 111 TaxID=1820025 RepID=UPI0005313A44|nr:hypothetical protein [Burkholderia sp. ABCPW 111]KGR93755.1 hypothetical protein X946_1756 [Burkholderia sp. ABCPW 111]
MKDPINDVYDEARLANAGITLLSIAAILWTASAWSFLPFGGYCVSVVVVWAVRWVIVLNVRRHYMLRSLLAYHEAMQDDAEGQPAQTAKSK